MIEVETKQTLRYFWQAAIKHRGLAVTVLAIGILLVLLDVSYPLLFKYFVEECYSDHPDKVANLYRIAVYLMVLGAVIHGLWRIKLYINTFFQPKAMRDLQNLCYQRIIGHSYNFFTNQFTGRIAARVNRFAPAFESIADACTFNFLRLLFRMVVTAAVVGYFWPLFGVIILIWAIILVTFIVWYSFRTLKYGKAVADQESQITSHLSDTVTNSRSVILFGNRGFEFNIFSTATKALQTLRMKAWNMHTLMDVFISLAVLTLEAIWLFGGIYYLSKDWMSGAGFVLLQSYINQIADFLWQLGQQIKIVFTSLANANEMTEMLMESPEIVDAPNAQPLRLSQGRVEFKNVTFAYNGSGNLIDDLNLAIQPGEKVALVGHSGAGKSTLVKLLLRLTDVNFGAVLIDGQNIKDVTLQSLYQAISLVPQDAELFHRSLFENISYGKHGATLDEVITAAKAAHCHDFISHFTDGYDTMVGERGVKLSGGER